MNTSDFSDRMVGWIESSLAKTDYSLVRAYCFNLIENAGSYSIELIGSPTFSETDLDWACDEVFQAHPRSIEIPEMIHERQWESCLSNVRRLLIDYLSTNSSGARLLKVADAVAVGFVDGDLDTIHTNLKI